MHAIKCDENYVVFFIWPQWNLLDGETTKVVYLILDLNWNELLNLKVIIIKKQLKLKITKKFIIIYS